MQLQRPTMKQEIPGKGNVVQDSYQLTCVLSYYFNTYLAYVQEGEECNCKDPP